MEASSDNIAVSPLVAKVFDLEMLREKILEYALFDGSENGRVRRKMRRRNACTYRLVCKAWLQSTSRLFRKLQEPLFSFYCFTTTGRTREEAKVPVDVFVESVAGNKLLDERVPPFTIYATGCNFQEKNCKSFLDCLTHCGDGLVQLHLQVLQEHASVTRGRSFRLPNLQSLNVYFDTATRSTGETDKQMDVIQSIFDASQQLKSFVFKSSFPADYIPNHFSNLVLPSALQHVDLNCMMDDCKLQVLLKNHLSKFKSLKLCINKAPFQNDLITGILENVRKTLENFEAGRAYYPSPNRSSTTFRLPFMDKLKRLCIDTPYLELEGPLSGLERLVPSLSHVTFTIYPAPMFRKWIEGSCFESVSSLTVSLVDDDIFEADQMTNLSLDVGTMNMLNAAFPNLVELDIVFYAAQIQSSGFPIMMQLRKLKRLYIRVYGGYQIQSSDVLDALVIGVSQDSMPSLRTCPVELWEYLSDFRTVPSIRNLTDLETLHLTSDYVNSGFSFISDLSFLFAFLKMPRLTNLLLGKGFSACILMAEKWKKAGRTIETNLRPRLDVH